MSEFIDREKAIANIKAAYCCGCEHYNGVRCRACQIMDAMDVLEDEPAVPVIDAESMKKYLADWKDGLDGSGNWGVLVRNQGRANGSGAGYHRAPRSGADQPQRFQQRGMDGRKKAVKRICCLTVAALLLILTLCVTACGSTSAEAEAISQPCYHVTVYSPAIEDGTYAARRYPKYTITVDSFRELVPDSYEKEYRLLRIPLKDGRFELVSTSLVEIEYY
jgi:hypothetical protein